MIDASHGNTLVDGNKLYIRKVDVCRNIATQIDSRWRQYGLIRGVMIESHLVGGNQRMIFPLTSGQSITDGWLGWTDTVQCLENLAKAVRGRRCQKSKVQASASSQPMTEFLQNCWWITINCYDYPSDPPQYVESAIQNDWSRFNCWLLFVCFAASVQLVRVYEYAPTSIRFVSILKTP